MIALMGWLQDDLRTVNNLLRDLGNEKGLSQDQIDDLEIEVSAGDVAHVTNS